MTIDWLREPSNETIDKRGNERCDIHELGPSSSTLQIRDLRQEDGQIYKCNAKNEFGSGEKLIKLIVLGLPDRPSQVRVRDVWSRSALVSWLSQYSTTTRISNYTVQYWRKTSASTGSSVGTGTGSGYQQQQSTLSQNHRRETVTVDGLQNSALLTNLAPALTYELSVVAHNLVGQSEPSDTINVTTSEEEPSLPPTDVQVEARGSSSLRVSWKIPPVESHNGRLLGFYVGFRPRILIGQQMLSASSQAISGQVAQVAASQALLTGNQQQQQQQQSAVYSFKTADTIEGQLYYDLFLGYLKSNQDYEVTVRAFNKAGSGPDSHTIVARTSSARLPQSPNLQSLRVGPNWVQLKWTTTTILQGHQSVSGSATSFQSQQQSPLGVPIISSTSSNNNNRLIVGSQPPPHHQIPFSSEILSYLLYYQVQGERDWHELSVENRDSTLTDELAGASSLSLGATNSAASRLGAAGDATSVSQQGDLITSQSSEHRLSNLQAGSTYRIYVAAANDYGVGDPSNIVVVGLNSDDNNNNNDNSGGRAQAGAGSLGQPGGSGAARLLPRLDPAGAQFGAQGGFFSGWWAGSGPQPAQHHQLGLVYSSLSSLALLAILVTLLGYLLRMRLIKQKYQTGAGSASSGSSYPSSWTHVTTSDTMRSECSIKAAAPSLPPPPPPLPTSGQLIACGHHTGDHHQHQKLDTAARRRHAASGQSYGGSARSAGLLLAAAATATTTGTGRICRPTSGQQQRFRAETLARPVLSSHYYQPADLIGQTMEQQLQGLQFSQRNQPALASKSSVTLNRNSNRQLPPIPYANTLSMKEIQRVSKQHQGQQWCETSGQSIGPAERNQRTGQVGSQSPLIYGVVE